MHMHFGFNLSHHSLSLSHCVSASNLILSIKFTFSVAIECVPYRMGKKCVLKIKEKKMNIKSKKKRNFNNTRTENSKRFRYVIKVLCSFCHFPLLTLAVNLKSNFISITSSLF